jgi:hypothetical protein
MQPLIPVVQQAVDRLLAAIRKTAAELLNLRFFARRNDFAPWDKTPVLSRRLPQRDAG